MRLQSVFLSATTLLACNSILGNEVRSLGGSASPCDGAASCPDHLTCDSSCKEHASDANAPAQAASDASAAGGGVGESPDSARTDVDARGEHDAPATGDSGTMQRDAGNVGPVEQDAATTDRSSPPLDLCEGVVCKTPPSNTCASALSLQTYDTTGTCLSPKGDCAYTPHSIPCTCQGSSCSTDPCVGLTCNMPPPPTCRSRVRTAYAAIGACTGGSCTYAPTSTPCASNQQCAAGDVCTVCKSDASCGASCAACPGAAPRCKDMGAASQCVVCLSDADCGGATPVCGAANTCIARPSCSGLAATCGATGDRDCCESSVVPAGTFYRSYDAATFTNKSYPATVSEFRLDTYEVTVGRFRKFVAAYSQSMTAEGAGKNPNDPSDPGWRVTWNASLESNATTLRAALECSPDYQTWTDAAGSALAESRPINCLDWFDAAAFCIWDGGRLPSEAEWNNAASGGSEQRVYPWGSAAPAANANLAVYGCYYGPGTCVGVSNFARVGSIAAGTAKWGHKDMAGNVWEWVEDWYLSPYAIAACSNCTELTATANARGLRGGGFFGTAENLASSHRGSNTPSVHADGYGARCARNR